MNLIGKKLNKLTVLRRASESRIHKTIPWEVLCDCGNTFLAIINSNGKVYTSCTCRRQDLSNKSFGQLTVLKRVDTTKYTKSRYLCNCSCGNTVEIGGDSLLNGHNKSCGCLRASIKDKSNKWKGCGELSGTQWNSIKNASRRRSKILEFEITIEYAWSLFLKQNRICALSGIELDFGKNITDLNNRTASLDRIDSSKGYIEGNIQWVHKTINVMKMDLSDSVFISFCKKIAKFN